MENGTQELRALVKRNLALTEDIDKQVRAMRRSARWGRMFQLLWWGLIIVVSGAAYYYLQPYLDEVVSLYHSLSAGTSTATSSWQELLRNTLPR